MPRAHRLTPYLFLAPAAVLLACFVLYPVVSAAWTSLTDWIGISRHSDFVGLGNYLDLLADPDVRRAALNTCLYVVLTLPASLVLAFGAALLVKRGSAASTTLRLAFAVPFVVSIPVVSVVWVWLFDPNFGLVNYGLTELGLGGQNWLGEPATAMAAIAVPSVWRQFGYFMLILLAGIKGVDPTYHEAARLDGASYWQRAFRITLPLLGPQLFLCLVLGVVDSFQVFAQVDLMTAGGPLGSTNVVVYELYRQAFTYFHIGYACAIAILLMIFLGITTYAQQRWLSPRLVHP